MKFSTQAGGIYKLSIRTTATNIFWNLQIFLPLLLLTACTGTPKDDGTLPPPLYQQARTIPANPQGGYAVNPVTGDSIQPIVNSVGDTLITGVPVPAQGKRIHPDSVADPKVVKVPAIRSHEGYSAQPNRYKVPKNLPTFPVDESKLTKKSVPPIAKGDTTHYIINRMGQKIPTGVPIPAKGKKVPTKHPQPTHALSPKMKDAAIANIQSLDVEQGMASPFVMSFLEDKNGNLWFGTFGGVSKYDGQSFIHFTQKEGLSNNIVLSIVEDKNGNLWFGTDGGGVCKYDGRSFTHFTEKEGLINDRVWSILEDKNGNLWFGTIGGGVCKYDGRSFTHFTEKEGLSSDIVLSIVEDKSGNLWFGTIYSGVSKYDGQSFTHFTEKEGLSSDIVLSILEDKSGNLWFGTHGGVSKYDGRSFTHFTEREGLCKNRVSSIVEDKKGNLWFGTEGGGVCKYDGKSFTHFTEKEGLSNNRVLAIVEDKTGNLWFGTFGGGACKYDGRSFAHLAEEKGLNNNGVFSMVKDKNDNLWFCTLGGGATKYDGRSFTHFIEKEGLSSDIVLSILEDKKGNFWFGTINVGISKYDGKSFTHFTEKEGLSNNTVRSIVEDKNGHLWFGTHGGVSKYDGQSFIHFTEKEGLSDNEISSIVEDKKGNLWFSTEGGGVSKYDGRSFTHFTEKEGLISNIVYSILEDEKGRLWFGTDGGVSKYDGRSFTHFTEKEGLISHTVLSIVEDKKGNLWFGTQGGGTSKYDGKSFIHFTQKEGLSNNTVRSIVEDKKGDLWFGTDAGVSKMEKDADQTSPHPPVVNLRHLYINEAMPDYRNPSDSSIQTIQFDSVQAFENYPLNARIPSDQNHLSFQYSAIDCSAPAKIKYSFRLLGLDNQWSKPSASTLADYRNLPDGKFTFQVRAIGESGKWSKAFDYTFTILPPWWKTGWAFTFYALLFLAALRTFSLWRERKLRQEKEQLQQKVEERTLELKTKSEQLEHSLVDLKSTQAQLIQSEKLASLGELTAGIAHEIQNPLNFVNNFAEVSAEMLGEMKEEIKAGNTSEVIAIADDLEQNLSKINHHGQRASSIVKGMLEHSRPSSGVKTPTDLNALTDEYLRLAYHGLRAKDNNFNATMETHFDPDLPLVSVIPQDIGRVLLNLINNAFYAVDEKQKQMTMVASGAPLSESFRLSESYTPTISLRTKRLDNAVEISIKDNGPGIPEAIKDKIFQPFFTTKPTGQGTGLGLSLAYDIVTKGHGGSLAHVASKEFTTFIIHLPA